MQCYPLYTNISCCTWTKVEKSTCILISRDKEISWLEAVGLATGPSVSRLPCLCLYSAFVSDRLSSGFSGRAPSVRRRAPRVPRNESLSDYRAVLATRSQASCVTGLTTRVDARELYEYIEWRWKIQQVLREIVFLLVILRGRGEIERAQSRAESSWIGVYKSDQSETEVFGYSS